MNCEYLDSCGGGHLAQRWSRERRFDNPSVYCESWKRIFGHIWARIAPTLSVEIEAAEKIVRRPNKVRSAGPRAPLGYRTTRRRAAALMSHWPQPAPIALHTPIGSDPAPKVLCVFLLIRRAIDVGIFAGFWGGK